MKQFKVGLVGREGRRKSRREAEAATAAGASQWALEGTESPAVLSSTPSPPRKEKQIHFNNDGYLTFYSTEHWKLCENPVGVYRLRWDTGDLKSKPTEFGRCRSVRVQLKKFDDKPFSVKVEVTIPNGF